MPAHLPHRLRLPIAALAAAAAPWCAAADLSAGWQLVGRQGLLLHVIVPVAAAADPEAYQRELPRICGEQETCFVNFYTNSTGAAAALPLPDAIATEATAVYRRSAKQGSEGIRFSCRLKRPEPGCF